MKKEELELLKENYNNLLLDREKLRFLLRKIRKYEKTDIIKDYNNTINEYNDLSSKYFYGDEKRDNNYFLSRAIRDTKITSTYDTYVYLGSYKYPYEPKSNCDDLLEFNDPRTEYVLFKNIELPDYAKGYLIKLNLEDAQKFILNHNVIFPENTDNHSLYFYEFQLKFYDTLVNKGEKKALKLINKD